MPAVTSSATTPGEPIHSAGAHRGTTPDPERQIHRACGDLRAALMGALELLSGTTVPRVGRDDVFRAFSDLGRVQQHVDLALHATNLLDQMVGVPAEDRQPWSYYRDRIRAAVVVAGSRAGRRARP